MQVVQIEQSVFTQLMDEVLSIRKEIKSIGVVEKPLNTKEAADFLGLHENTLYRRVKAKTIPFHRNEGTYYFFPSELVESIKNKKTYKNGK